jgi:predicted SprT family Zn-dependent metalloprotease
VKRKSPLAPGPVQLPLFGKSEAVPGTGWKRALRRASAPAAAPAVGAEPLQAALGQWVRAPLKLILTDNRSSIITVKKLKDGCFQVRLHRIFTDADAATLRALAGFIRRPNPQNRRAMGEFIRLHLKQIEEKPPSSRKAAPIRARGKVYHLAEILAEVARTYGINAEGVRITWGQRSRKRKFRSIRFGSYFEDRKLIRIHPLLDRKEIPRFFVEYIVYHELLHFIVPDRRRSDGRRSCHHREFKQREKQFARFPEALAFEKHLVQEH